jgi:stage II sporulation protein E
VALNESQAAVRLLENLLNSGFDRDVTLRTINSVLQLKSSTDTFATLDMLMIDLFTAEVDFIKVGSAPSFIRRGRRVGVVTSNSLPIGIRIMWISVQSGGRFVRGYDHTHQ